jgi:hypothetical protein
MILVVVGIAVVASVSLTILGVAIEPVTMLTVAGICGFVAFTGFMGWFLWSANRFYADTDDALIALGRGDLESAAKVWSGWEARRAPEMVCASAAHNLGWTAIRQGDPRRAIEILGSNDLRRRGGLASAHLAATTAQDLALCYGLLGNLEAAEAWFAEADRRRTKKAPSTFDAMRAFVRAVVDCRAGRAKEVAGDLRDKWTAFEDVKPDLLRPMRVVRAFADRKTVSDLGSSGPGGTRRPAYPGEYDFLGVEWPEMAAFLSSHDLASKTR